MNKSHKPNGSNGKPNGKANGLEVANPSDKGYRLQCIQRYRMWIATKAMADNEESLIEWDRLENKKQLLDWDREANFLRGLRQQAAMILSTYSRERITDEESGLVSSMPSVWKRDGNYVQVNKAATSPEFADYLMKHWLTVIRSSYLRMREIGIKHPQIHKEMLAEIKRAKILADGIATRGRVPKASQRTQAAVA